MARAAEIIGDRWSLLILREAFYGVGRYEDMRADLDAPRSMLSDRLGRLVEQGLLTRSAYREPGHRTQSAYVLTPAGQALALTFMALTQWGEAWVLGRRAPIQVIDAETGESLKVALTDRKGALVDIQRARLAKRT